MNATAVTQIQEVPMHVLVLHQEINALYFNLDSIETTIILYVQVHLVHRINLYVQMDIVVDPTNVMETTIVVTIVMKLIVSSVIH